MSHDTTLNKTWNCVFSDSPNSFQLSFTTMLWFGYFIVFCISYQYVSFYYIFTNCKILYIQWNYKSTLMNASVKVASVLFCRLAKESPSPLPHCLTPNWILSFSDTEGTLDMLLGLFSENSLQPGPTSAECGRFMNRPPSSFHRFVFSTDEKTAHWSNMNADDLPLWAAWTSLQEAAFTTAAFLLTRLAR